MLLGFNSLNNKLYPVINKNMTRLEASSTRLASGDKFSAGGAGLVAYSSSLRGKIRGNNNLLQSLQVGLAYASAQESIMTRIMDIGVRLMELASTAVDNNKTTGDLQALQSEFAVLVDEIQAYQSNSIKFNGKNLISQTVSYRYGISTGAVLNLTNLVLSGFAKQGFSYMNISSNAAAAVVLASMGRRLGSLARVQAIASEHVNRIQTTLSVARIVSSAWESLEAGIRNVDVAEESAEYMAAQVQIQATEALLAHNNSNMQNAMRFFNFG